MPPMGRPPPAGALPVAKTQRKERLLAALTRMNDRDTAKAAAEELLSIVHSMDQEGLPIVVSCLCSTGAEQKVYARKECARAIGLLASEICPLRDQALQAPHINRMLGQLKKAMQDPDSTVREAASEALARVAQGLSGSGYGAGAVVKLLFECLVEQKKELNTAACTGLGLAAPYMGALEGAQAKELIRKLNSPAFQAPGALLAALARTDPETGEASGLLKSGAGAFVPLLSPLVGQPPTGGAAASAAGSGSGIMGALSSKDWQVRMAAADCLRAAALLFGPMLEPEGVWGPAEAKSLTGRCLKGLDTCRFDKVKDVREVARAAIGIYEDLQAYGASGGSTAGWAEHINAKLVARGALPAPGAGMAAAAGPSSPRGMVLPGPAAPAPAPGRRSPLRRSSPSRSPPPRAMSPGRRSPPPERTSPFRRQGSLNERFRQAHFHEDVVADPYSRPGGPAAAGPEAALQAGAQPPVQLPRSDSQRSHQSAGGVSAPAQPPAVQRSDSQRSAVIAAAAAAAAAAVAPPAAAAPAAPVSVAGSRQLSRQASASGQRATPEDASAVPKQDQGGLPPVGEAAPRPSSAAPSVRQAPGTPPLQRSPSTASNAAGAAAGTAAGSGGGSGSISLPAAVWEASQARMRQMEAAQKQLLEAHGSLQEKVRSLEAQLSQAQVALSARSSSYHQLPSGALNSSGSNLAALLAEPSGPSGLPPQLLQQQHSASPLRDPLNATTRDPFGLTMRDPLGVNMAIAPQRIPDSPSLHSPSVGGRWAQYAFDAGGAASPRVSVQVPSSVNASQEFAAGELSRSYAEALEGDGKGGVHLMRLMQRTGPVWNELGHGLSTRLLATLVSYLAHKADGGLMLGRIMPWLWRLADEENTMFTVPLELQGQLLQALQGLLPSITDAQVSEKAALLVNTLKANWPAADGGANLASSMSAAQLTPQLMMRPPPFAGVQAPPMQAIANTAAAAAVAATAAALQQMPQMSPSMAPMGVGVGMPPSYTPPAPVSVAPPSASSPALLSPSMSTLQGQLDQLQNQFANFKTAADRASSAPSPSKTPGGHTVQQFTPI